MPNHLSTDVNYIYKTTTVTYFSDIPLFPEPGMNADMISESLFTVQSSRWPHKLDMCAFQLSPTELKSVIFASC